MTYGQIKQDLSSINLEGKTKHQKGNHEILVNWTKPFADEAVVDPQNLREIRKRIKNIKKNIVKMSEITKSKINALNDGICDTLCSLYSRWQEEKEYEDWDDYISVMKKKFETLIVDNNMTNAVYYSCGKRPFGLTFDFEGHRVTVYANSSSYGWKSKPL
jgi:hypothetical protein